MEYTKFIEKLGLDDPRPSVLAKIFGQRVNTVSNWRMRGHVPAEYVVQAYERQLFKG